MLAGLVWGVLCLGLSSPGSAQTPTIYTIDVRGMGVGDVAYTDGFETGLCRVHDLNWAGCSFQVFSGTALTFTPSDDVVAFMDASPVFDTWGGLCAGQSSESCTFTVTGNGVVEANFKQVVHVIVVNQTLSSGQVEVVETGDIISNEGVAFFDDGDTVTLRPIGGENDQFQTWQSFATFSNTTVDLGCRESEISGEVCQFVLDGESRSIGASFGNAVRITVNGQGTIEQREGYGSQEQVNGSCGPNQTCVIDKSNLSPSFFLGIPEPGWSLRGWPDNCILLSDDAQLGYEFGERCTLEPLDFDLEVNFSDGTKIFAAMAPNARSMFYDSFLFSDDPQRPTTAFLSILGTPGTTATRCSLETTNLDLTHLTDEFYAPGIDFRYFATDETNQPIGEANPTFELEDGVAATFLLELTSNAFNEGQILFYPTIDCEGLFVANIEGVNSLNIAASVDVEPPDVITIGQTPSADGVVRVSANPGVEVFTAAATNIGAGDGSGDPGDLTLTVSADTGQSELPLRVRLCETDANTGQCLGAQAESVTTLFQGEDVKFFSAFVYSDGPAGISFNPATDRVFLRFTDANGTVQSVTSAAVIIPPQ